MMLISFNSHLLSTCSVLDTLVSAGGTKIRRSRRRGKHLNSGILVSYAKHLLIAVNRVSQMSGGRSQLPLQGAGNGFR